VIINVNRKYLEIKNLDNLIEVKKPNYNCKVDLINPPDFHLNKFFYKQIGRKHRWIDRLIWDDKKWIDYIEKSNVKTYVLQDNEELIGYFEQIFENDKFNCEIAYFGILENFIGKKYGGYLLTEAIKKSFSSNTKRVWVHTSSLDHPNALKNYIARGMKIFKSETIGIEKS
tara:strand:- start:142 stop:654 length:513 start_codon:yes stop_codon:yes gene_type:complete